MPRYQLVIFDFDGTLADSFAWFIGELDGLARRFRFKAVEAKDIEAMRSLTSRQLIAAMEVAPWKLPFIARHTRRLKAEHAQQIKLFDGAEDMLRRLKAEGITVAIVSSDAEANVRVTLGAAAGHIDVFACGASLFGKPAKFRQVLRLTGVDAGDAIAIGDEMRDADAAEASGLAFGAVSWGFASAEALASRQPTVLFQSIGSIADVLAGSRVESTT